MFVFGPEDTTRPPEKAVTSWDRLRSRLPLAAPSRSARRASAAWLAAMYSRGSAGMNRARIDVGMTLRELWLRYFELGGRAHALELDAILHGAFRATEPDGDRIAQALNERFTELGLDRPVPYPTDRSSVPTPGAHP